LLPHRLERILGQLSSGGDTEPGIDRLCALCASVTAMSGASIMLMSDEMRGSVCSTDDVAHQIEELQYTLGEGPSLDAYRFEQPVIEPDLAHARAPRWPVFTPLALEAGARAVFGFPLLIGVVRLGALSLYRVAAGTFSDDQHADALVMADVAARAVLAMQANAPPGEIAVEFEGGASLQRVVHQASGMIAAQLDVTIAEALIRLRARAFAESRPVTEIAEDVVARRLRFHRDDDPVPYREQGGDQ
jgi:hypothetical protein